MTLVRKINVTNGYVFFRKKEYKFNLNKIENAMYQSYCSYILKCQLRYMGYWSKTLHCRTDLHRVPLEETHLLDYSWSTSNLMLMFLPKAENSILSRQKRSKHSFEVVLLTYIRILPFHLPSNILRRH